MAYVSGGLETNASKCMQMKHMQTFFKRSLCGQIASLCLLTNTTCFSCRYNPARQHLVPYSHFIIGAMGDPGMEIVFWIVLNGNLHGLLYKNNIFIIQ